MIFSYFVVEITFLSQGRNCRLFYANLSVDIKNILFKRYLIKSVTKLQQIQPVTTSGIKQSASAGLFSAKNKNIQV